MKAIGESAVATGSEVSIADALALAQRMHRDAQLEGAEQLYLRILELQPRNPDAWHFLGLLRYQRREFKEGIAAVRKGLSIDPNYADAHANLANMLLERGSPRECEQHLKRAIRLKPKALPPRLCLGILLRAKRRTDESIRLLEQLLEEFPDNALVHNALGKALLAADRRDEAFDHFIRTYDLDPKMSGNREQAIYVLSLLKRHDEARRILNDWLAGEPDNPTARHLLAACGGAPIPERCDDGYVKTLFDAFSTSFDAKLGQLEYRAPELIEAACERVLGPRNGALDFIDVGCGTGLLGPLVKSWCRRLVGVDLSTGMIAQARDRHVYDELVEAELTAYLRAQPAATVDVVASADTLCYFGAIDAAVGAAHAALRPGGSLLISLEHDSSMSEGYRLQYNGRYCHRRDYVERVLESAGFEEALMADAQLRMEGGKPVQGLIVAARKPAQAA